nr:MAG TPA: hypothetical protein [Caudoviricetes sp.]
MTRISSSEVCFADYIQNYIQKSQKLSPQDLHFEGNFCLKWYPGEESNLRF